MDALTGQLLAPAAPQLPAHPVWVDVLTGEHVRVELRESTLVPESDTDRVRAAAAAAQQEWARYRHAPPPFVRREPTLTAEEAAQVFGQRYGGTWRPVQW